MTTYVRLRVGPEHYAVPVSQALEIADLGDLVAVPGAPPGLLGVRNLRGRILPVVDLAQLLGAERTGPPPLLLVTEAVGQQAGLAIDEVTRVGELPGEPSDLPGEADGAGSPFLSGAVLTDGELVGLIDVAVVLESLSAVKPLPGGPP